MKNTLDQFASPSQNNSRAIVRTYLEKMNNRPSEWMGQKIEDKFGVVSDFKDSDLGNEGKNGQVYDVTDQFSEGEVQEMLIKGIY